VVDDVKNFDYIPPDVFKILENLQRNQEYIKNLMTSNIQNNKDLLAIQQQIM
jgi:hypothetical protein